MAYVKDVGDLQERIKPLISKRQIPYPRWISTPDGDEGQEWCSHCGYFKVRNLRRRDRKRRENYFLDGGWRTEEEHFCYCANCGCRLDVILTDFGVDQEIENYEEHGFSTDRAEDAYEIGEMLSAVEWRSDRETELDEDRRRRVIAIATRFLAEAVTPC